MILDAHGNEVNLQKDHEACPRCGVEDKHDLIKGFGGWQMVICECGETLASGRERPEGA